jgi:glycosyltransferase involved in cell wall biosynthesis
MNWLLNRLTKSQDFLPNIYNTDYKKTVVILYKTFPFFNPRWRWLRHTNNWEIFEITKIFNKKKYNVFLLDRSFNSFEKLPMKNSTTLFIGINGVGSGRRFPSIMKALGANHNILLTTTEEPIVQRDKYLRCYSEFKHKTGFDINKKRLVSSYEIDQYKKVINEVDAFISIGNLRVLKEYQKYNKDLWRWYPALDERVSFIERKPSDAKHFLFIAGGGLVEKGLDVCIDACIAADVTLHICASDDGYDDFWQHYTTLATNKIINHGFTNTSSKLFFNIARKCQFVISTSFSDASATSISLAMRTGLIPIVTLDTGHDVDGFGFEIDTGSVESLASILKKSKNFPQTQLDRMSKEAYNYSKNFTKKTFSNSFSKFITEFEFKKNNI